MSFETGLTDSEVEALYLEYKHIITQKIKLARATFASFVDEAILEEQALQAFIRCCRDWSPAKGASFSTLLHRAVERELKDVGIRKGRALARGWGKKDVFPLYITDEMSETIKGEDIILPNEGTLSKGTLSCDTLNMLSPRATEVLQAVMTERSMRAVCTRLGVSSKKELKNELTEICGVIFGCSKDALEERARAAHLLESKKRNVS